MKSAQLLRGETDKISAKSRSEHYRTIWEAAKRYWAGLTKASSVPTEEEY